MAHAEQIRVGDQAKTATRLSPSGIVIVGGRRHSARSVNTVIVADQPVVIVGGDIHGFVVETLSENFDVSSLPDFGKEVHSNFGESVQKTNARRAQAEREWQTQREAWRRRVGPRIGCIFSGVGMTAAWKDISDLPSSTQIICSVIGLLVFGAVLGSLCLRFVDRSLEDIDAQLQRFSLPTVCFGLTGASLAAAWSIPRFGVGLGIGVSLVAAIVAGFPLPALMAFAAATADVTPIDGNEQPPSLPAESVGDPVNQRP